mmetsp:Transcript_19025/g.38554  ORF Transcript_19025/g.38554 Transcript_19025/m.38554 type:complete len:233 (-) Transcript_19025:854-1552(-)
MAETIIQKQLLPPLHTRWQCCFRVITIIFFDCFHFFANSLFPTLCLGLIVQIRDRLKFHLFSFFLPPFFHLLPLLLPQIPQLVPRNRQHWHRSHDGPFGQEPRGHGSPSVVGMGRPAGLEVVQTCSLLAKLSNILFVIIIVVVVVIDDVLIVRQPQSQPLMPPPPINPHLPTLPDPVIRRDEIRQIVLQGKRTGSGMDEARQIGFVRFRNARPNVGTQIRPRRIRGQHAHTG